MEFNFFDMKPKDVDRFLKISYKSKRDEFYRRIVRSALNLAVFIRNNRLSGFPLKIRTGLLKRSVVSSADEAAYGTLIYGRVNTVVPYAKIHEYGQYGPQNVLQHTRMHEHNWSKKNNPPFPVQVSPYTRIMSMPQRSFMRSSLSAMKAQIIAFISGGV